MTFFYILIITGSLSISPLMASDRGPVYCSEDDCYFVARECALHDNRRLLFFEHMLEKVSAIKAPKQELPLLPMMAEGVRYIIGGYAQEDSSQYTIKRYEKISRGVFPDCKNGRLTMDESRKNFKVEQQTFYQASLDDGIMAIGGMWRQVVRYKPFISMKFSPVEAAFFESVLKKHRTIEVKLRCQEGTPTELLMRNEEDPDSFVDKFLLKQHFAYNKVLKAAGLLPKTSKNMKS